MERFQSSLSVSTHQQKEEEDEKWNYLEQTHHEKCGKLQCADNRVNGLFNCRYSTLNVRDYNAYLRYKRRKEAYKSKLCRNFHGGLYCEAGAKCPFVHNIWAPNDSESADNFLFQNEMNAAFKVPLSASYENKCAFYQTDVANQKHKGGSLPSKMFGGKTSTSPTHSKFASSSGPIGYGHPSKYNSGFVSGPITKTPPSSCSSSVFQLGSANDESSKAASQNVCHHFSSEQHKKQQKYHSLSGFHQQPNVPGSQFHPPLKQWLSPPQMTVPMPAFFQSTTAGQMSSFNFMPSQSQQQQVYGPSQWMSLEEKGSGPAAFFESSSNYPANWANFRC